jgi:NADH:ubiquinone oxidoreductase subunit K
MFDFFFLSFILFTIGLIGIIINRSNLLLILMSIELLLLSINSCFLYISTLFNDINGIVIALLILTIAAAETSIGLALIISYYRLKNTISIKFLTLLHG